MEKSSREKNFAIRLSSKKDNLEVMQMGHMKWSFNSGQKDSKFLDNMFSMFSLDVLLIFDLFEIFQYGNYKHL